MKEKTRPPIHSRAADTHKRKVTLSHEFSVSSVIFNVCFCLISAKLAEKNNNINTGMENSDSTLI